MPAHCYSAGQAKWSYRDREDHAFGAPNFHWDYPGTVSVKSETLLVLTCDVCMSLDKSGFRNFVLLRGHAGRLLSITVGAQNWVGEMPEAQAIILNTLTPLSKVWHNLETV